MRGKARNDDAETLSWLETNVRKPNGDSGCWIWIGSRDKDGYGTVRFRGGYTRVHRVRMILDVGRPLAVSEFVCHRCDNPPCVNPAHLWIGSNRANQLDASAKGRSRGKVRTGQDNHASKLTPDGVRLVRVLLNEGLGCGEIARRFRVTPAAIHFIRNGQSWRHVP